MDRAEPPQDKGKVVYGILCLLGVATLLPWNVFITENEFFDIRVHVKPTYRSIADNFESAIVLTFQFVNFLALLALVPLQRFIPLHQQMLLPLGLTFAVLVLAAAVALWTTASGVAVILAMLPSVALMGMTTALLQGGLFGLAGLCPPIYVQATSVGQAVAGFGVSVLSFLTLWAAPGMEPGEVRRPKDVAGAATAYFGLSAAVMAVSVGGYWWLQHLPFWHFHTRTAVCWEEDLKGEEALQSGAGEAVSLEQGREADDLPLLRINARPSASGSAKAPANISAPTALQNRVTRVPVGEMLWLLRWHALVLALDFALTIAVFPSVTAAICSVHNPAKSPPCFPHVAAGRLAGDLWTPLLFLLFNGGDLGGRLLAGIGQQQHRAPGTGALLTYALTRVVLVTGLLLCHVITPHPWRLPELVRSDLLPTVLIFLLGLTNGHLASLTSMHMPSLLPPSYRERSGPIIAFSITIGLTLGSILAVLLTSMLQSS
ncbi:g1543 [Coccomyxa elongata]